MFGYEADPDPEPNHNQRAVSLDAIHDKCVTDERWKVTTTVTHLAHRGLLGAPVAVDRN